MGATACRAATGSAGAGRRSATPCRATTSSCRLCKRAAAPRRLPGAGVGLCCFCYCPLSARTVLQSPLREPSGNAAAPCAQIRCPLVHFLPLLQHSGLARISTNGSIQMCVHGHAHSALRSHGGSTVLHDAEACDLVTYSFDHTHDVDLRNMSLSAVSPNGPTVASSGT